MIEWFKRKWNTLLTKRKEPFERASYARVYANVSSDNNHFHKNIWLDNYSPYRPFYPNSGDLDPRVSSIANGRRPKEILNYKESDFHHKYGHLTTELGYGIIYEIISHIHNDEKRSLRSALREAIARTDDPILCLIIMKDYCERQKVPYPLGKFEAIADEIISNRERFYSESNKRAIRAENSLLTKPESETNITDKEVEEFDRSRWLFNGRIIDIYPIAKYPTKLFVHIFSKYKTIETKNFDPKRFWAIGQNVVLIKEDNNEFRVLDFGRNLLE